jgi:pimeloyl-ACP methyl ester carboxylesterase
VIAKDYAGEVAGVVIGSNGGKFPSLNTPQQMQALADARSEGDDEAWDAALEDVYFAEGFRERDPVRAQWLLDLMRSTPADRSMIGGAVRLTPPDSYWGQFDCPTLMLYGDEDRIGHRENAEDLHRAVDGSKLVYIEQAGHFVIAEQAERFSAEILKWVEEVGL